MSTTQKRSTPRGLGFRGRELWRNTMASFVLDPTEEVALLQLCRCVDELDRIDLVLKRSSLTCAGSMGQLTAHPLLHELRAHRETARQLTKLLNLAGVQAPSDKPKINHNRSTRLARMRVVQNGA
jgi:hypothetical protein